MTLVSSFAELLQQVSFVMTQPTFDSFVTLLTGWVFAGQRPGHCRYEGIRVRNRTCGGISDAPKRRAFTDRESFTSQTALPTTGRSFQPLEAARFGVTGAEEI